MRKTLFGIAIVLAGWALATFVSCKIEKKVAVVVDSSQNANARPGEVLKRFFVALNAGDTAALAQVESQSWLESMRRDPAKSSKDLAWDKQHPIDFQILSDTSDGIIGYVTYRIRREWGHGVKDTIIKSQVFKEDGQWKVGGFPVGMSK